MEQVSQLPSFIEVMKYFVPIIVLNIMYFFLCWFGKKNDKGYSKVPLLGKLNSISVWFTMNGFFVTTYLFIRDGHILMSKQAMIWIIGNVAIAALTVLKRMVQKTEAIRLKFKDFDLDIQKEDDELTDDELVNGKFNNL